ncbi:MAG TPA: L,D-transpeptidase family protein [Planctomycetota bacterium]|nr:L,D-transpeptidase family protein [Planctomycetota bacterium]
MGERWNRAARAAFPWGKAALCLLIAAAAGGAYWYWTSRPAAASAAVRAVNVPAVAAVKSNRVVRADDGPIVRLAILVFKSEKRIEVWGERAEYGSLRSPSAGGPPAPQDNHGLKARVTLMREYPILASSGTAGPKLRGGDRQVPEGIYKIAEMNPRSRFHLSMKLDYPNAFDKAMAQKDGRTALGGDVCIHGKNTAVGCMAIGDAAIEDLYALVTQVKAANVTVIIAPNDLREQVPVRNPALKLEWLPDLYEGIARELMVYQRQN